MSTHVVQVNGASVTVRADENLLDACLRSAVSIPFSCRGGVCQTCLLRCTEGAVPAGAQRGLPPGLRDKGYLLACQCRPEGPMTLAPPSGADRMTACVLLDVIAAGPFLHVQFETMRALPCRPGDRLRLLEGCSDAPDLVVTRWVILVDDVQFLASKARTEEEFFHTFNALHEAGSQLVLTSDCPPRDLRAVEDRLRERFEAGLVTSIAPPDLATRRTVLRMRAQADRVPIDDLTVLDLIAERVTDNIRSLEGALIRVVAYHSLTRRPITAALVAQVLDELYPLARPARRSILEIQELTGRAYGLTVDDLISPDRSAAVTRARHVAIYLARTHTDSTLPAIGRAFGGRNHATILNAVRRTQDRLAADPAAATVVAEIAAQLAAPADRHD